MLIERELNSGYLEKSFGVLHGDHSQKPLVYDLMETFRQPFVDRVVLPIFSRKQHTPAVINERDKRRFFKNLKTTLEDKTSLYGGKCLTFQTILSKEITSFREAVLKKEVWMPHEHRWGNSSLCK